MHEETKVVIVGAGIAGLSCALHLVKRGIRPVILEASDAVGGRMRSDIEQGYILDRGFQVFLSAYPEANFFSDALSRLKFHNFEPGAIVRHRGKFHRIVDPFRRPALATETLLAPVGSVVDKWLVAAFRMQTSSASDSGLSQPSCSAHERLKQVGFSDEMIDSFFRPFFGGIFLDGSLLQSAKMLEFLFAMFSGGHIAVPNGGMQEIPQQLASSLHPGTIRFGQRVSAIEGNEVRLEDGSVIRARDIVIATDARAANSLLARTQPQTGRSVSCLYYACNTPPTKEKLLILNGEGVGLINNMTVISNVAPSYSPDATSLVSVTVLGNQNTPDRDLEPPVKRQLEEWYGADALTWKHLRTYRIHDALPGDGIAPIVPQQQKLREGLYICGDHTQYGSINGALKSGRLAAELVAQRSTVDAIS
ncbi:MAG: FAD-dependent oxidoreductase [Candidatus Obscuribacterales bacterium]|nr:FAD-dependent oxidoreductase [Candidatus Obscuribacterales bacterium]